MSKQYIYFKKYKARNAIFGAIIGDSLGSTLEFQKTKNAKCWFRNILILKMV